MKNIYDNLLKKINDKKVELSERQDSFEIMWNNEKHSGCFERNAINDLLIMQQLKSEISEMKYWKMLINIQINK